MNKLILFFGTAVIAIIFFSSFKPEGVSKYNLNTDPLEIPENINATLQKSCYGCHNPNSKNTKAKTKLNLDELTTLKTSKLVSKLGKMAEMLENNKMPPQKFAEFKPEKVPTPEEKKALIEWTKSTASTLAGE